MNRRIIFLSVGLLFIVVLFGFFYLKHSFRFVTDKVNHQNVIDLTTHSFRKLQDLNKLGVNDTSVLSLEFHFLTNKKQKALSLTKVLMKLKYKIEIEETIANNTSKFLIKGLTTKLEMDNFNIRNWIGIMCRLGYENDCFFVNWETNPDQNITIEKDLSAMEYDKQGLDFYGKKEYRKSELYFGQAINLNQYSADYYLHRGNARMQLGNNLKALVDYNMAILINSGCSEAYENRGIIKKCNADYGGAISDLTVAIKLNPHLTDAYFYRGNSEIKLNDTVAACADWRKMIELGDTSCKEYIDEFCK